MPVVIKKKPLTEKEYRPAQESAFSVMRKHSEDFANEGENKDKNARRKRRQEITDKSFDSADSIDSAHAERYEGFPKGTYRQRQEEVITELNKSLKNPENRITIKKKR